MLNPEGTYAITHRVELAECDPKDRMRLSWIMRLQQEAGEKQLLELGIGHQKLWEEGMVFLLSKMAVQILQTPRYLQEIVVETCPLPVKGAAFQRETVMTDRTTGQKLVQIYTSWMMVNTNDWKILRPAAFPYPLIRGEMDGDPNLFKWKVDTQQGRLWGSGPSTIRTWTTTATPTTRSMGILPPISFQRGSCWKKRWPPSGSITRRKGPWGRN